ncbi:hypothetical protein CKO51_23400 [Rhodopirellula sp. SM50]|nr:hypothetical protein [Rhodopirellula sp. SM50]PAY17111.1 hypothetical protein CKO51_23400 [Rhodopirellula sp. SM50]
MNQTEDALHQTTESPLHRIVSILIGISFNSALSVAFGCTVGVAIAVLANSGPLHFLGPLLEMAVIMIPLWSLPSGILGGIVCGVVRGENNYTACVCACIPAILLTLTGLPQGAPILNLVVIGGCLLLVALTSTARCCFLIRRMVRKRNAVVRAMREDPAASPGKTHALLATAIAMVLVVGGVAWLLLLGRTGSEFLLGLVADGSLINMLCGLHLLGTYPNRVRIGWAVTTISFSTALIAGIAAGLRSL